MIGPDDAGRERLRRYFEEGFRDLYLRELRDANDRDLKMGTFLLAVAFTDALAIAHAGRDKGLEGNWKRFVMRYFPQPDYEGVAEIYHPLRSRVLHNFSSRRVSFTHNSPEHHMPSGPRIILNRENFVADVETAFHAFYADVQDDPNLATTVLAFLDRHQPLTVKPVDLPSRDEVPSERQAVIRSEGGANSITGSG